MVGGARVRAKPSGNFGLSFPASRRRASTGAARRVKSALSCASANGRRRTRSGSGSIVRPRCNSLRVWRRSSKIDRAALLALAFADLCVRGGERAGLLGLTRPLATQGVVERFAEAIATDERLRGASQAAIAAGAARRAAFDGSDDRRFSLGAGRRRARDSGRERGRRDRRTRDDRRSDRGDLPVLRQHRVSPSRRLAERAHAAGAEFARRLSRASRRPSRSDPQHLRPLGLGHEHPSDRRFARGDAAGAAHAPFRARIRRRA